MDADRMRDERLAELRRAVYARDAPPDAAAAYAAALAELARTTAVDGPPPDGAAAVPEAAPRHRRWAAIGAACGVAATLVLGTVLAARPEARPAAAPTALPTATTPTRIAPPPVPGPVLATFTSTSGAFGATLDAQGRHVFLAAECAGSGTVTIALSDGSSTILTCSAGMPTLAMQATATTLHRFTITTITAERPIWALTVGTVLTSATTSVR